MIKHNRSTIRDIQVKSTKTVKEAYAFLTRPLSHKTLIYFTKFVMRNICIWMLERR